MDQSNRLESGGRRELAQGFESSTLRHIKRRGDGMADVLASKASGRRPMRVRVPPSVPCVKRTPEESSVVRKILRGSVPSLVKGAGL